jgi:hypothetical protein
MKTAKGGIIHFSGTSFSCTVRIISNTGAGLALAPAGWRGLRHAKLKRTPVGIRGRAGKLGLKVKGGP